MARSSLSSVRSSGLVASLVVLDEPIGESEFLTGEPDFGARLVIERAAGRPVQTGLGVGLDRVALRRSAGIIQRQVKCGARRRRVVDLDARVPAGVGQRVVLDAGRCGVDLVGIFLILNTFTITKDPTRPDVDARRILMGPFTVYNKDNVEAAAK